MFSIACVIFSHAGDTNGSATFPIGFAQPGSSPLHPETLEGNNVSRKTSLSQPGLGTTLGKTDVNGANNFLEKNHKLRNPI